MEKCFVIQPFDNDKFDKRFKDVFEPAIQKANLEPYRVDRDMSVKIPIDEIEKGIIDSVVCFAEISTNNPNVWYELGFAFACRKDVIMVCSDEREGKFPFDIQHRHIVTYKTGSKSDFEDLEENIFKKIKALLQKAHTVEVLNSTPIADTEGLKSHEIAILIICMESQLMPNDYISAWGLKQKMNKAGYTDIAASVGFRTLLTKKMVETFKAIDFDGGGEEFNACRVTETGEKWILDNQDQLVFRERDKNDSMPLQAPTNPVKI